MNGRSGSDAHDSAASFFEAFKLRCADTAHDLKTPLNIAVLNLELLRMRIRRLSDGVEDSKITGYASSIDVELRRMAMIFDSFFGYSVPPRHEPEMQMVDFSELCRELGGSRFPLHTCEGARAWSHPSRAREAVKLFFEAAQRIFSTVDECRLERSDSEISLVCRGRLVEDVAAEKVFKFYYSDPSGSPDLRLASARLIAETYGGSCSLESDGSLVLKFPSGER
jgi:hypothetical protein